MPVMTQYGFIDHRVDFSPPLDYGKKPAVNRYISTTSDPVNAIKRVRPAEKDLVWMGTRYSKTLFQATWSQIQYCNFGNLRWRVQNTSRTFIGDPVAIYPGEPYDPMNPLLGKINGDLANLANMLGEYKQTATMFQQAAGRFRRSVNYAKRAARQAKKGNVQGSYGSLRSALKSLGSAAEGAAKAAFPPNRNGRPSLSNAWLQWHFGVDTLLQDIHSLCVELQEDAGRVKPLTVHKFTKSSKKAIDGASIPYSGDPTGTKTTFVYASFKRTLVAYVEFDSSELKLAADHGLTNPASLVWELTTLSFVVDWFIGIGEWLTALNVAAYNITRSRCYETKRKYSVQHVEFSPKWFYSNGFRPEGDACFCNAVHKETNREIRTLAAARPRWKPSASVTRVATGLALLRQMRK